MTVACYPFGETLNRLSDKVALAFDENDCTLLLYVPHPTDAQAPHERDEVYVVARGDAEFDSGGAQRQVSVGDAIFVSKNEVHKFNSPSEDFAVWAFFYPS